MTDLKIETIIEKEAHEINMKKINNPELKNNPFLKNTIKTELKRIMNSFEDGIHPAGCIKEVKTVNEKGETIVHKLIVEPIDSHEYVYTILSKKGLVKADFNPENKKYYLDIEGRTFTMEGKPLDLNMLKLIQMPDKDRVKSWVKGEVKCLNVEELFKKMKLYFKFFIDLSDECYYDLLVMTVFQSWFSEMLTSLWYVAVTGSFGGGKCERGDSELLLPSGEYKKIENVVNDKFDNVISMNKDYKLVESTPSDYINSGIKKGVEIKTKRGLSIKTTPEHPYYTADGWKKVSELIVGDYIATARTTEFIKGEDTISEYKCSLLGLLLGDGGITNGVKFFNNNIVLADEFKRCGLFFKDIEFKKYKLTNKKHCGHYSLSKTRTKKNNVSEWLKTIGVLGHTCDNKFIPSMFFTQTKKNIGILLNRLYACDGNVNTNRARISYSSNSFQLVKDMQRLLLRFSIVSRINLKKTSGSKKHYRLTIDGINSCVKFISEIGILGKEDNLVLLKMHCDTHKSNSNNDIIPKSFRKVLLSEVKKSGLSYAEIGKRIGFKSPKSVINNIKYCGNIKRSFLQRISKAIASDVLKKIAYSDIYWEEIVELNDLPEAKVYDLSVPEHQNFVSEDIVCHNSSIMESCIGLCKHGCNPGDASISFIARGIDKLKCSVFFDEFDSIAGDEDSEYYAVVRLGQRRGPPFSRMGDKGETFLFFDVFGVKLFSIHNQLEDALQSRSFIINTFESSDGKVSYTKLIIEKWSKEIYTDLFLWFMTNFKLYNLVDSDKMVSDIKKNYESSGNVEEARQLLVDNIPHGSNIKYMGRDAEMEGTWLSISSLLNISDLVDPSVGKLIDLKNDIRDEMRETGINGLVRDYLVSFYRRNRKNSEFFTKDGKYFMCGHKDVSVGFNVYAKGKGEYNINKGAFTGALKELGFIQGKNKKKMRILDVEDGKKHVRAGLIFDDSVQKRIGLKIEPYNGGLLAAAEDLTMGDDN